MAHESSGPGPFVDAALNTPYRAIWMQSDGTAATLSVMSNGVAQTIYISPGERIPGNMVITSGTLTSIKGYVP